MLKKIMVGLVAIVCIALVAIKLMPVGEMVDPLTYFDEFSGNEYNLVYEDQRIPLEEPVKVIEGNIYLSYEFIDTYLDTTIFYDEVEEILTVTDLKNVLRMYPDSDKAKLNGKEVASEYDIKSIDGKIYIPVSLLQDKSSIAVTHGLDNKLFIVNDLTHDKEVATLKNSDSLRTHPLKRTTVVEKLKRGETVVVYSIEDGFARVRSANGVIGYLPESSLKNIMTAEGEVMEAGEVWPSNPLGEKVRLVWDQLTVKTAGFWNTKRYSRITEANVISPTWFQFADEQGNLSDIASKEYVDTAHAKGLEVWPLMSHNFTNPGLTEVILSSTSKRQHVINQLIEKAAIYGYDGINIDIENIQTSTSKAWVQFMRELYPALKEAGLVVTVDVYMPSEWSGHYEREKVAAACDYFIVMAYDQHWLGSENAGSVSEIPWVEEGIQRNLEEVPKEKLVLGIPFYTRIWKETANGLETRSLTMPDAQAKLKELGVTPVLDPNSGQLYAEKVVEDGTYKLWIEDKDTIAKRIGLVNKYDLAGYGAWKLGLETLDVWDSLALLQ